MGVQYQYWYWNWYRFRVSGHFAQVVVKMPESEHHYFLPIFVHMCSVVCFVSKISCDRLLVKLSEINHWMSVYNISTFNLRKHKNGHNIASLTDTEITFRAVVAEFYLQNIFKTQLNIHSSNCSFVLTHDIQSEKLLLGSSQFWVMF